MKTLFLSLALLFGASSAYAQAVQTPLPDLTNLEEFSSHSGTLIQREMTRIGDFAGLRVDVVKATDLIAKTSIYGARVSRSVPQGPTRDAVFLDADEIDALMRAIEVLKASAFSTTPDNFTDLVYRTRGGFAIGAVYADRKWIGYLRLDRFDPRTSVTIEASDIESLHGLLAQVKERSRSS